MTHIVVNSTDFDVMGLNYSTVLSSEIIFIFYLIFRSFSGGISVSCKRKHHSILDQDSTNE